MIKICTIGFTQKSAEQFFGLLKENRVQCVVDIRLHPDGQLSGFARRADLPFFLRELAGCDYVHAAALCPTEEILKNYRASRNWAKFKTDFEALMDERRIPESLDRSFYEKQTCCLLCGEARPEQCHRSMVAERMRQAWGAVEIIHLV